MDLKSSLVHYTSVCEKFEDHKSQRLRELQSAAVV